MIRFEKMQALGNDFIFIEEEDCKNDNYSELAIKLCDRHRGIGADGLVLIKNDPIEMKIYNQDGSEAQMCGNAMRCFITLIKKRQWNLHDEFEVLCGQNHYLCRKEKNENQVLFSNVTLDASSFLVDEKEWVEQELNVYGVLIPLTVVQAGCVHTVIVDELNLYKPFATDISTHPLFKDGCNVDFVRIISENEIEVHTYERGVGFTLSCGSGNVASAYVAWKFHKIASEVKVRNRGGNCHIKMDEKGIWLCGSCQNSFTGFFDVSGEETDE